MKTVAFILLITVARLSAQEPTPTPVPSPATCPDCGMDKAECKDDKPAPPPPTSDEATFTQLEQSWGDAIVHSDETALARIVADEFTSIGPDGDVSNKTGHLAAVRAWAGKISSFKFSGLRVHVYGDAAVVTGNGVIRWEDARPGEPFRWTDVFVRRDGRWQAVSGQATNIRQAALSEE